MKLDFVGITVILGIIASSVAFTAGAMMGNSQAFWWSLVILAAATVAGIVGVGPGQEERAAKRVTPLRANQGASERKEEEEQPRRAA